MLHLQKTLNHFGLREILLTVFCFLPISIIIGKAALNINIIIFDIIILIYLFKNKKLINFKTNSQLIILSCFIIFLFLNLLFSENLELSIRGFLGLFKNIIFCIGLILFINYEDIKKFFSPAIILCIFFVIINIYLQYFFGEDLFGNESVGQNRSTAVFGNQIPGSYILKFFFLGLMFTILNNKILANLVFVSICTSAVIVTNERMPIINIVFFSFLLILLFPKISLSKKILSLIFYFLVCISVYNLPAHNTIHEKNSEKLYENLISRTITQFQSQTNNGNILNLYWFQHFRAANDLFKDNFIIGSGIKTYRYSCPLRQLDKDKSLQLACNIHPHNLYLEIISETGILGLFLISFLLIKLIIRLVSLYVRDEKKRYELLLVALPVFMLFNPLQFTGSFFSTYSGFFFFLILGVAINFIRNYSNIK